MHRHSSTIKSLFGDRDSLALSASQHQLEAISISMSSASVWESACPSVDFRFRRPYKNIIDMSKVNTSTYRIAQCDLIFANKSAFTASASFLNTSA